jgi:hypothetical protein
MNTSREYLVGNSGKLSSTDKHKLQTWRISVSIEVEEKKKQLAYDVGAQRTVISGVLDLKTIPSRR